MVNAREYGTHFDASSYDIEAHRCRLSPHIQASIELGSKILLVEEYLWSNFHAHAVVRGPS